MNPFKQNGQMLPIASINSVFIDDDLASDLFRPELIVNEIIKDRDILGFSSGISNHLLLQQFDKALNSEVPIINAKANEIGVYFGRKLASLVITLRKPSQKSLLNRQLWTKKHWDFWKNINTIYFVGGLTSTTLTQIFFKQIVNELSRHNINDLEILFLDKSINLGTKGLSTLTNDGEFLLFDFGQTNIKRRFIVKKDSIIVSDNILLPIKSTYLKYKNKSIIEVKSLAKKLDSFIINTIIDTVSDVNYKGSHIFVAIANYVIDGQIYLSRGGYGKLAYINGNYEEHLSNNISFLIGKEIIVKLYHDTTAMALSFKDKKATAIISLGTAFGIAFVD